MSSESKLELIYHNGGRLVECRMNFNSKNTYDLDGLSNILKTLNDLGQNPEARAIILSSNQEVYFSNGLEPKMFLGASREEVQKAVSLLMDASQAFYFFPLPTVSLIEGHCMAAGAVFAIFSDYRFMVDRGARIGFSEALIGLNFPSFPAKILSELVGHKMSRDLLYSGKLLKAEDAKSCGLVDFTYSKEMIRIEALKFASKLSNLPIGSARGLKKCLTDPNRIGVEQILKWDKEALTETILTMDAQEGFRSILESRKPNFNS